MSIRSSKDFQHVAYNQAADILSEVLIKIPDKAAQKAYYFFKRHFWKTCEKQVYCNLFKISTFINFKTIW